MEKAIEQLCYCDVRLCGKNNRSHFINNLTSNWILVRYQCWTWSHGKSYTFVYCYILSDSVFAVMGIHYQKPRSACKWNVNTCIYTILYNVHKYMYFKTRIIACSSIIIYDLFFTLFKNRHKIIMTFTIILLYLLCSEKVLLWHSGQCASIA